MTDQETNEEPKARRTPEPTVVQVQIENNGVEGGWSDLRSDTGGESPIVFDGGVSEARAYMKGYKASCRFRIITIRGPYYLAVEQTTKATITTE